MVSTQKVLVLALAATAVVFQGCDDDSAPKNNHRHNNNGGRLPTQPRDNNGGLSSFNRRRRNNGNQNNRQNNDPLDGNQRNNRRDQHQDRNQNDQGKGGQGKGKDGEGKGNDELPPPPPRAASSAAILKEIKEKFESRLQFSQAGKADGGSFGDIHVVKVKCQDGARDVVVKIPAKLEELKDEGGVPLATVVNNVKEASAVDAANLELVRGSPHFPQIYASIKSPDGFTSTIMESLHKDLKKLHPDIALMPDRDIHKKFLWALQFLQGLKVLHDKGYIHKDLKPANVMLSGPVDTDGTELRLIDLGSLCSVTGNGKNKCQQSLLGTTPVYAPPEFFIPDTWEGLSAANKKKYDVWAAGLVILELFSTFSGEVLFGRNLPTECINTIPGLDVSHFQYLAHDYALGELRVYTDIPVRNLLKRMLADRVEDRATIDEAIQMLKRFVEIDLKVNIPSLVLTEQRKGPKCLQSCYDGNCLAQCHVKNGFEVGRVSKVQNDQCVEPPKPVQPHVHEKHHFQEL